MNTKLILVVSVLLCAFFMCGAACDHQIDDWTVYEDENNMKAMCPLCYEVLVRDIDRQELAHLRIPGEWEYRYWYDIIEASPDGEYTYTRTYKEYIYTLNDDYSYELSILEPDGSEESFSGSWVFVGYEEQPVYPDIADWLQKQLYNICLTDENGRETAAALKTEDGRPEQTLVVYETVDGEEEEFNCSLVGAPGYSSFSASPEETETIDAASLLAEKLPGTWVASYVGTELGGIPLSEEEKRFLDFDTEGGVVFRVGEETLQGRWTAGDGTRMPEITLCPLELAMEDGSTMFLTYSEGTKGLGVNTSCISYNVGDENYTFEAEAYAFPVAEMMAFEDLEKLVMETLPGCWLFSSASVPGGENVSFENGPKDIVFKADGSFFFTSQDGSGFGGTWSLPEEDGFSVEGKVICDVEILLEDGTSLTARLNCSTADEGHYLYWESDGLLFFFDLEA